MQVQGHWACPNTGIPECVGHTVQMFSVATSTEKQHSKLPPSHTTSHAIKLRASPHGRQAALASRLGLDPMEAWTAVRLWAGSTTRDRQPQTLAGPAAPEATQLRPSSIPAENPTYVTSREQGTYFPQTPAISSPR